jgi:hypothetical protein
MAMRTRACIAGLVSAFAVVSPALGSNRVATGASGVSLKVTAGSDRAVLTYQAGGRTWIVTACCARNARVPSTIERQVAFRLRYHATRAAATPGYCGRYDGPALPAVVVACKAPDGSYWVAQRWPRMLPVYGLAPSPLQAEPELRLAHWRGRLPVFTVRQDWAYRGRFDHLYGSLRYLGHPMHGFATNRFGAPLDRHGVLVYVDTLDSAYGPGWRRENGFVTHNPTGIFCYGFFPHDGRPTGKGRAYRATAVGPGVLPDLAWQAAERPYSPSADARANAQQARRFSDRRCRPN